MVTVSVVAVVLCATLVSGFFPGPLPLPPPLPVYPSAEPRPQKQFPGSVCPTDTTCVRPQVCSRQCRPGWDSFGLSSCYLVGPALAVAHGTALKDCAALDGHLPVLEDSEEVARLVEFGAQWTNATWDGDRAVWLWGATGQTIDFARLGTAPPADGSTAAACLILSPGAPPVFQPTDCAQTALYICETGSSSVARCARQKERICCAVSAIHYGEPCYVDEQGTRCEQRIREGYFPLGESLVRPTEGAIEGRLSWDEARALCRADGGDLLTVDDSQMNQKILNMLRGLEVLGATEFYIGLSSNGAGEFSYVNGTPAEAGSSYLNFATAEDASRPDACVFYSGLAWASGDCAEPRDFICHIRRVRHSLRQEPEAPRCGVRQTQGVLGKSGSPFLPRPPPPLPPFLPPLGVTDDGRRGAAQFGEITWQAAIWTRSSQADHQFSCSGALVHPAWVLTSADCVSGSEPADLKVTVGDWDLDETQPVILPPVALDVTIIRVSPGRVSHGPYGPLLESGRLAMLRITPELDGDEYPHVGPVCLPDAGLLQHVNQLRCVVTGWRGGVQPTPQFWRPHPKPDLRDILRKFETGVRHDPECQDVAHHLKQLRQRPAYPPPFPPPSYPPFPPPHPAYPVPYSAAGLEDLESRSQYAFGPPPFFGPPTAPPPPPPAEQPELYVCPRDLRCIPDRGTLLACALPPPPPPHYRPGPPPPPPHYRPEPPPPPHYQQEPPPPPHYRPGPPPPPPYFYRSAQNDTAETPAAPADSATAPTDSATDATAATAPAPDPADAYEQLSKGFRPPIDENEAGIRARRSTDTEGVGSAAAPAPAAAAVTAPAADPAPPATDPAAAASASGGAKESAEAGGRSAKESAEAGGRSAFQMPHSIIGAFQSAPPPFVPQHHHEPFGPQHHHEPFGPQHHHEPFGPQHHEPFVPHHHEPFSPLEPQPQPQPLPGVQPAPASTRHYDAYVLVGIASSLTDGCSLGQMIFDDVIQEAEFVQQVLHRDG